MTRKSILLPLFLTLCAAAAARAEVKDACTVISAADAQAILGEPVGPGKSEDRSSGGGNGSECRFRSTIGSALSAKVITLTLQYRTDDVRGSAPKMADTMRAGGFQNVHPVEGIGDAAIWGTLKMFKRISCELTVLKGKSLIFNILVEGLPDDPATLDRAKHLASTILPNA